HVARSDILWRAGGDVRGHRGGPGGDGVTIGAGEGVGGGALPGEIAPAPPGGGLPPGPPRARAPPQAGPGGGTRPARGSSFARPLGIPTVRDRVVMAAAKIVLEPIFEADFLPVSFGFRPKRSARQALEAIRVTANRGAEWVLDADVSDCFGSIDWEALVAQVA